MTAKQLLDELRNIDFLINYGPEEEKEAVDLIDKTIKEHEAELLNILKEALECDKYNDHSSGIWQIKAKKALGVYYMICPECEQWHNQYNHGCLCDCHNNGEE